MSTPVDKLPDCPQCGLDELWYWPEERAGFPEVHCYYCGWEGTLRHLQQDQAAWQAARRDLDAPYLEDISD